MLFLFSKTSTNKKGKGLSGKSFTALWSCGGLVVLVLFAIYTFVIKSGIDIQGLLS